MSHFGVLVFTAKRPTDKELKAILQPYHEYECTGVRDRYVVWVDHHDEALEEYNGRTETRWRDARGALHEPYDDRFYREPTAEEAEKIGRFSGTGAGHGITWHSKDWGDGKGYRAKVHLTAEEVNMEAIEVPQREIESFDKWARDYHGYRKHPKTKRFGRVTNPNAKWDWWVVGGRWTGHLHPFYDPTEDPSNSEKCWLCRGTGKRDDELGREMRLSDPTYTCNGCRGTGWMVKHPPQWKKFAGDQMMVGNIPIDEIRAKAAQDAAKRWDKFHSIVNGRPYAVWGDVLDKFENREDADKEYENYPAAKEVRACREFDWLSPNEERRLLGPRAEYIAHKEDGALRTHAFIGLDGKWYEKGDMGWWGVSSNNKEPEVWNATFRNVFDSLPSDAWVTVVDCHI